MAANAAFSLKCLLLSLILYVCHNVSRSPFPPHCLSTVFFSTFPVSVSYVLWLQISLTYLFVSVSDFSLLYSLDLSLDVTEYQLHCFSFSYALALSFSIFLAELFDFFTALSAYVSLPYSSLKWSLSPRFISLSLSVSSLSLVPSLCLTFILSVYLFFSRLSSLYRCCPLSSSLSIALTYEISSP